MTPAVPASPSIITLERGATQVVLRVSARELPTVLHWGAVLPTGDADALLRATGVGIGDSVALANPTVGLVPLHSEGWLGHPGLLGSRNGSAWSFLPDSVSHEVQEAGDDSWPAGADGAARLVSIATDATTELVLRTELELHPSGVVRLRATVRNPAPEPYRILSLEPALPVPAIAAETLDLTGRHTHEREPQRRSFDFGRWTREAWGGRPGHDSATVLCAGAPGFGFRRGQVWGLHVAWSGNAIYAAERTTSGRKLLRGGELLLPDEIILGADEEYSSPWLVASWGDGLDELQAKLHTFIRDRPTHPNRPRPVLLNTWEAVYFDHDPPRLLDLAERAAQLGVERFVLDDGWFMGRRDDTAGLGDWYVDAAVWPDGLQPLADRVHELGMEFGLWFEPEMVNLNSDLAREHPDWIFGTEHGPGIASRHQHVLDLGNPDAYEFVLSRVRELVSALRIDFIKWDHNRPLIDAGHAPTFAPGVHQHTLALYRLIDQVRADFPALEIESCCGGGGRIDLGIMERTDRVWVSDCIDAQERQRLQRWTSLLLPPELLGTHVGAADDHTTRRVLDLDFRAGTAIWGHLGIEWDLALAAPEELDKLGEWIGLYKELRGLLHTGVVVHDDPTNPAVLVEGVIAQDGSDALYRMSVVDHSVSWPLGNVRLPGLDPQRDYTVRIQEPSARSLDPAALPAWIDDPVTVPGAILGELGLAAPTLGVDRLVLIRATAAN